MRRNSPHVEGDGDDRVEDDRVGEVDHQRDDGRTCRPAVHVVVAAATDDASRHERVPGKYHLELVADQRLPDAGADHADEADGGEEDDDLRRRRTRMMKTRTVQTRQTEARKMTI